MAILIDGYNLLNVAGVEGRGRGTPLARARQGLLGFLAGVLSEDEAARTTIVFDAKDTPPGLPREEHLGAIRVLFSKGYKDADELIEQLIDADTSPRQLLVVSSDHRLHRAARRRKASAVDSDQWLAELRRRRHAAPGIEGKPPATDANAAGWLAEFSDIDVEQIQTEVQGEGGADASFPSPSTDTLPTPAEQGPLPRRPKPANDSPLKEGVDDELLRAAKDMFPPEFFADTPGLTPPDVSNPFPPGHGEDVAGDEV